MAKICKVGKDNQIYGDFTRSGRHYVYYHCLPYNGEVFYVGLGKNNRCNQVNQRNNNERIYKNGSNNKFLDIRQVEE